MASSPSHSLLVDLQATQSIAHGERGIARYAASQTKALMAMPGAVDAVFLNPALPFPSHLDPAIKNSPLLQWNTARLFRRMARPTSAYYITSPLEISPPYAECIISPHNVGSSAPLAVTLYDLIPIEMPERYLANRAFARQYRERMLLFRIADLVLAISEHSRQVAIKLLGIDPHRIFNIGGGADAFFSETPGDPEGARRTLERLGIDRPYMISVLGQDPRKNLEGLVQAFAALPRPVRSAHQLVIVGRYDEHAMGLNRAHVASCGLTDRDVVFTRRITDDELRWLYRQARLLVFPSFAEGYGLPVAEAIACGCPAIASNVSALPEILEWEPATFDPGSTSSMAGKMEEALKDGAFRSELSEVARRQAPMHTWENVARRTMEALDRLRPRIRRTGPRKPRVALVGPVPPQHSGVADYNARVVKEMAACVHLDVFTNEALRAEREPWRHNARILDQVSFGTVINPRSYDAIIYTIGNSHHYVDAYDLLMQYPGIVWLHDARLYGLYLNYALTRHKTRAGAFMRDKLKFMYGSSLPLPKDKELATVAWYQKNDGVALTAEIAANAEMLIVHSEHALRLVERDVRGRDLPPSLVVPLAIPELPDVDVPSRNQDGALIASFGIVHPVKEPETLLGALALMNGTRLALVGPIEDDYRKELEGLALRLGVADRVTITGRLDYTDYVRWLRQADCAVQLRRVAHGESSATVNDCIAAGVPVLTNSPTYLTMAVDFIQPLPRNVTAAEVAAQVKAILSDARRLGELRAAGKAYAAEYTFAQVVGRILNTVGQHLQLDLDLAALPR
jgi:glycosyltransferase involved in cell wall biosynthesis